MNSEWEMTGEDEEEGDEMSRYRRGNEADKEEWVEKGGGGGGKRKKEKKPGGAL